MSKMAKRTRLDPTLKIILTENGKNDDIANDTPSRRNGIDGPTERLYRLYGSSLIQQASQLLFVSSSPSLSGSMRTCTTITACVIFQRLYHCISLQTLDVWAAAMGALLCACKTEEIVQITPRHLIVVFVHLYRRRRRLVVRGSSGTITSTMSGDKEDPSSGSAATTTPGGEEEENDPEAAAALQSLLLSNPHVVVSSKKAASISTATAIASSSKEKEKSSPEQAFSQDTVTAAKPLFSTGPLYKEWFTALVEAEGHILRCLGFTLYWIPNEHAHRFVPGFLQNLFPSIQQHKTISDSDLNDAAIESTKNDDIVSISQEVWKACNDAYRLDACVRFPAEIICVAAIWLVLMTRATSSTESEKDNRDKSNNNKTALRGIASTDWWTALVGPGHEQEIANCANLIASVRIRGRVKREDTSKNDNKEAVLLAAADLAFLKPLTAQENAFNGPESFLWAMDEGNL